MLHLLCLVGSCLALDRSSCVLSQLVSFFRVSSQVSRLFRRVPLRYVLRPAQTDLFSLPLPLRLPDGVLHQLLQQSGAPQGASQGQVSLRGLVHVVNELVRSEPAQLALHLNENGGGGLPQFIHNGGVDLVGSGGGGGGWRRGAWG